MYELELRTARSDFGALVLTLHNRESFDLFEAAVHNFANIVAMRLENLEYRNHLEELVRKQTEEIETNRAFFESIFDQTGDISAVVDLECRVVRANAAALRHAHDHGPPAATLDELVGHKCHEVLPGLCAPGIVYSAEPASWSGTTQSQVIPIPSQEHPRKWIYVSDFPVVGSSGKVRFILKVGRDVTELKTLEADLTKALAEKDLLLREIHHRVKNNLNMAVSLLRLQFGGFADESVQEALTTAADRIHSMSLVHQSLHRSETQERIGFREFVDGVVAELSSTYGVGGQVRIERDIADIAVGVNLAVPVSLIITELITNALKYAFPRGSGTVRIRIQPVSEAMVELSVEDDGIGLPEGFDSRRCESLGMQILYGLTQQIGGTLELSGNGGTSAVVTFPRTSE
mgnify:CR=1 FL=1